MIPCPFCAKEMRNVFEYDDDFKCYKVYHCWPCNRTVVLNASTEKIEWIPAREVENTNEP